MLYSLVCSAQMIQRPRHPGGLWTAVESTFTQVNKLELLVFYVSIYFFCNSLFHFISRAEPLFDHFFLCRLRLIIQNVTGTSWCNIIDVDQTLLIPVGNSQVNQQQVLAYKVVQMSSSFTGFYIKLIHNNTSIIINASNNFNANTLVLLLNGIIRGYLYTVVFLLKSKSCVPLTQLMTDVFVHFLE